MTAILYLIMSALLGTVAALLFVSRIAELSIISSFLLALIAWSPSNFVFTKAQTYVKNVATALIVFSVASTIADTLGSVIFQQTQIGNYLTLIFGLLVGALVIRIGASSKDIDLPEPRKEMFLYFLTVLGLIVSYLLREMWYVQIAMYSLADLFGAVLVLRLLKYIPENNRLTGALQFIIGVIAFAPLTFSVVLLLRVMGNVAIAGPSATILSCGVATVGSKLLTGKRLVAKDVGFMFLAVLCVILIFLSF